MAESNLRLLIAENHTIVRNGLVTLLSSPRFGMEVVGEAVNGIEAVELAAKVAPDVILLDLFMPEMDGFDAIPRILAITPKVHILVLSSLADSQRAADVIRLGARGFVHKDATIDDLIRAIQSVARGQSVVPADVTATLLGNGAMRQPPHPGDILTEREREVMTCLVKGMTNKEIAAMLNISANTVRAYVHTILEKFGVANRTQAALYAIENNLLVG
ncbi:MAG: response regulator transcription factor [Caldilineaceae bacterium]|nr:response regulator transcription factor [Caldilineaceae bacterium]